MWIKCEEGLPETPKNFRESLGRLPYLVAYPCGADMYGYQTMGWCDGWNCSMMSDGTISKEHEITNIVAWFKIPEYEG